MDPCKPEVRPGAREEWAYMNNYPHYILLVPSFLEISNFCYMYEVPKDMMRVSWTYGVKKTRY